MARGDVIPVAPLRAAVERHMAETGETYATIAARIGWDRHGRGDTSRLKRRLGLQSNTGRNARISESVTYAAADQIALAVHADPIDVGR